MTHHPTTETPMTDHPTPEEMYGGSRGIVDMNRSAKVGTSILATVIHPDGVERLWILDTTVLGHERPGSGGCACPACAPGEQLAATEDAGR